MTKESEETPHRSNVNADQTVSTSTKISKTNCEKITVESNDNENASEANVNRKSEMSGNSGNNVVKRNLDNSALKKSEVQNNLSGTKNQNENKKVENNEEEDVPGDFFDDFLKEDFMLGLDIVDDDAWEKEVELELENDAKNTSNSATDTVEAKKRKEKKKSKRSDKTEIKFDRSERRSPGEKRHKQKKRKQDVRERLNDKEKNTRNKEKVIDADEFDIRRDPEKTKRDIEQYKAKCEKDKEKKIISEKLSFVETGLVPPGMEMEIDIEEVKRQKSKIDIRVKSRVDRNLPLRDLREHLRRLRSKSKSPMHKQRSKSPIRKQRSPEKVNSTRRSVSPVTKPSPKKRRTRSPVKVVPRRSPVRINTPIKDPHMRSPINTAVNSQQRSPVRVRRSPLPSRRSRGRSYERGLRRSRSLSPFYRGRRSRYSPLQRHRDRSDSRESEREKWLKRRRSRSRTPRRKREEKKSFLQEIAEKLNETRPQPVNIMQPLQPQMHYVLPQPMVTIPSPVPAPAPVPPPNIPQFLPPRPLLPTPQQQFDPYDQNFFIGTPQPIRPPIFVGQPQNNPPVAQPLVGFPPMQRPLNPLTIQPSNSPQLQNSSSQPVNSPQLKNDSSAGSNISRNMDYSKLQQMKVNAVSQKEDLAKLFQDKKITLSEFLAITAKPEVYSSSPAILQEKIKVIQRCHEAIKILGIAEKKYTGKLVVQRTTTYKEPKDINTSPLLKRPAVTFPFTQHQFANEQKTNFTNFVNDLLMKLGLLNEAVVDVDNAVSSNTGSQTTPHSTLSPPPPPLITHKRNMLNEVPMRSNKFANNQLSKMIQTDVFKCEHCEKRKKTLYKTCAVQCGGDATTFSVSTQVTEEDFYKFQKTQSLASLTPAQLLARSGSNRMLDKDNFDKGPSQSNYLGRMNYPEGSYNLSRYRSPSPPPLHFNPLSREEMLPSMFSNSSLRLPFSGGGGRGRDIPPNLPRTLDSINRFGYNYY